MTDPAAVRPRLRRRPGWDAAQLPFLTARQDRAFAWGRHDCALFAADWVAEMTGVDLAAAYRGRYATKRGAVAALRRVAGGDLMAAIGQALGPPAAPRLARRGDIVAAMEQQADGRRDFILGVVCGDGTRFAFVGPKGLKTAPLTAADRCWQVG